MNEVWDLVRHSHEENEKLRNDVHKIAQSCLTTHRKKTVIECPPCYGRIVDRCKQRYLNTEEVEWFTGRKPFLKSIDTVLTGMKAYHKDRSKLRQVIRDEKRKYYIDKVRNTVIKATAEVSLGADTLAEMLGSRNFPLKDLIDQIRLALQRTVSMCVTPARLDEMLVALNDMAPMLCDERYFIYKEYFFGAQPNQPVAKNEEPYLVALELLPPNDMVDRLLGHAKTNAGLIEQRDKWKMRLEEMRRARAAHELQKTEKKLKAEAQAKALQELREARKQDMARKAERLELMRAERKQKAEARELRMAERKSRAEARSLRKAEARARRAKVHVPSSLKFLPSCSVCSQALKRENFYVCELCMVLTDLRVLRWPTAFCSDECYSKGHPRHLREAKWHHCAQGDACIQLDKPGPNMRREAGLTSICKECANVYHRASIFCSPHCLESNFQLHRDTVHLEERDYRNIPTMDIHTLLYSRGDPKKYWAKNVMEHIWSVEEVWAAFKRRTGLEMGVADALPGVPVAQPNVLSPNGPPLNAPPNGPPPSAPSSMASSTQSNAPPPNAPTAPRNMSPTAPRNMSPTAPRNMSPSQRR